MVSSHVGLSMQRYLIVDPPLPSRTRLSVFAEIASADGNPNPLQWCTHFGLGGSSLSHPRKAGRSLRCRLFPLRLRRRSQETRCRPFFNLANTSGVEAFYNVAVPP